MADNDQSKIEHDIRGAYRLAKKALVGETDDPLAVSTMASAILAFGLSQHGAVMMSIRAEGEKDK